MRPSIIVVHFCVLAISLVFGSVAAAQLTIGSTVDLQAGPTFVRPDDMNCAVAGVSAYYQSVQFYVSTTGNYTASTSGSNPGHNRNPFLVVYTSPFDPTLPATNCLAADEDGPTDESQEASFVVPLSVGTIYTGVVTTSMTLSTGLISWAASGVGDMHYLSSVTQTTVNSETETDALLIIQLNFPDTADFVVQPSGLPAPTAAQVRAGLDGAGNAGTTSGSFVVAAGFTNNSVTLGALSGGTQYRVYVIADNGGNASTIGQYLFSTLAAEPDTSPDPIVFAPQFVPPNTMTTSNEVTISGINTPAPISITGAGTYSINGATATNTAGSVSAGDLVTVLQLSSALPNTITSVVLHVGDVDATFTVSTDVHISFIVATNFTGVRGPCLDGGVQLEGVNDLNDNGSIDDGELRYTRYLCNGLSVHITSQTLLADPAVCPEGGVEVIAQIPDLAPAQATPSGAVDAKLCHGLNSLVSVEQLVEDDVACPSSGIRVTTWVDNNGDGELTEGEPASTQTVCHASSALIETTAVAPDPEVCPSGGVRVHSGNDTDADGQLDDSEVKADEVICSGANGLVSSSPLDPNPDECPTGGVEVESGTDIDGNGMLDSSEVTSSRKACNAIQTLTRSTVLEPKADECPSGGVRVDSGLDVNGDATLDDDEVKATSTLCNGSGLAVRTRTLEVGSEECRGGGAALETGIDTDGDGKLDTTEVINREVVCKPPQLLFETEKLTENDDSCPHGGLRLKSGLDDGDPSGTAGDGKLQADEVDFSKALCVAPITVRIGSGPATCSAMPSQRPEGGLVWSLLAVSFVTLVRRRRRTR